MKLLAALPVCWLLVLTPVLGAPQRCSSPDLFEGMVTVTLPDPLGPSSGRFLAAGSTTAASPVPGSIVTRGRGSMDGGVDVRREVQQFLPQQLLGDYGKFSYDAVNKRWYSDLTVVRGEKQWQQVNILLHQKSVMYQYFPKNQTCLKTPIRAPFRRFGVPENATFLSQTYIGMASIPDQGVLTYSWVGRKDGVSYFVNYLDYKCIPQYEGCYTSHGWFSESFYNVTLGIQDPSVFVPPPECGDHSQEHSPADQ